MKGPLTMAQPSLGGASFAAEVVAQEPEKKPAVKKERDPYDAARTETTKLANLMRGTDDPKRLDRDRQHERQQQQNYVRREGSALVVAIVVVVDCH